MSQPNYVLKTNDVEFRTDKGKIKVVGIIKIIIIIMMGVIIISSFLFDANMLLEMSLTSRILFISLAIGILVKRGKKVDSPTPVEIWFYDDRITVYHPAVYYSKNVIRKEYETVLYESIKEIDYDEKMKLLFIRGDIHQLWYNYDKDGNLPLKPNRDRVIKGTHIMLITRLALEVDFVKEFEEHSPIKVIVKH